MERISAFLRFLESHESLGPQVTAIRAVEEREGRFSGFPEWVRGDLKAVLLKKGIERLYAHQRKAVDLVREGKNVAVSTPTSSGKSLCYNLPVLNSLLEDEKNTRALYLFPTKALSRDQEAVLSDLLVCLGRDDINVAVYDGDTPSSLRAKLRAKAHIIITNPTMLHLGILPNHPRWNGFFRALKFVVIDELHTLAGVYGSSVANVVRRLKRICRNYGSRPVFISCSATIGNPSEHAEKVIEEPVELVDEETSPRGRKHFVFYNPRLLNPVSGYRESSINAAVEIAGPLIKQNIQTIFFCRTRVTVEVLTKYLKDLAKKLGLDPGCVSGYRGGYLPKLRRSIEKGLREGKILAVVATNALELGIDIGGLDCVVLVGYPGSISSTWQRAGRAGRKGKESMVILIAGASPLDQYIVQNPSFIFKDTREKVAINPDNFVILSNQVKCAAFELPFKANDFFGKAKDIGSILESLERESHILIRDGDKFFWMADAYPAEDVSLDAAGIDNVVIMDAEKQTIIGEVDRPSSIEEVYEGAIYGHQGEQYLVEKFDYHGRRAIVKKVNFDYYTEAETETDVRILCLDEKASFPSYSVHAGDVHVSTLATMFKKIKFYTHENVGAGKINLPPEEMDTEAFILVVSREAAARAGALEGGGAGIIKGLARLFRNLSPIHVKCDPADLHVVSEAENKFFQAPSITVYDKVPGGVGLSGILFREHRFVLEAAHRVIGNCKCISGCPSCIGPGAGPGTNLKEGTRSLIEVLLE